MARICRNRVACRTPKSSFGNRIEPGDGRRESEFSISGEPGHLDQTGTSLHRPGAAWPEHHRHHLHENRLTNAKKKKKPVPQRRTDPRCTRLPFPPVKGGTGPFAGEDMPRPPSPAGQLLLGQPETLLAARVRRTR